MYENTKQRLSTVGYAVRGEHGIRYHVGSPVGRGGSGQLLAGLRQVAARDLWVDAEVVQRAREDGHRDRGRLVAVPGRRGVIVALARGDGTTDQPHNEYHAA